VEHGGSGVVVTVYDDRSFDLRLNTRHLGPAGPGGRLPRGGRPGIDPAGAGSTATSSTRSPRPSSRPHTTDLDAAEHIVAGTARSMGIEVVEDK
jgi:large subunit ribosomal protein L11